MAASYEDELSPSSSSSSSHLLSYLSDWVSSTYTLSSPIIETLPFSLSVESPLSLPQHTFHITWVVVSGQFTTCIPYCDDLKERRSLRQSISHLGHFVTLKETIDREGLLPLISIIAYGGTNSHATSLLSHYKSELKFLLGSDVLATAALRRLLIHRTPISGFLPYPRTEASPLILSVCRDNAAVLQTFYDVLMDESGGEGEDEKERAEVKEKIEDQLRFCLRIAVSEGRHGCILFLRKFLPDSLLNAAVFDSLHHLFDMEMVNEEEKIRILRVFVPSGNMVTSFEESISKQITSSTFLLRCCMQRSTTHCLRHLLTHFSFDERVLQSALLFACEIGSVDGVESLLKIGKVNPEFTVTPELSHFLESEKHCASLIYNTPMKIAIAHRPTLSQAIDPIIEPAIQRRKLGVIADLLHSHGAARLPNEEEVEGKLAPEYCVIL